MLRNVRLKIYSKNFKIAFHELFPTVLMKVSGGSGDESDC
ncbi:hypothetical protein ADU37_CDS00460 [Thermococcus sp. 2319x1]|nr:hypothetical protein ADU37_CDS00460 [Thermococcus sp. 2319x1]